MASPHRLESTLELALRSGEDVVRLRQAVRERAVGSGFSLVDQTKIVTAASELGLSLSGIKTALNVERGMELLRSRLQEAHAGDDD